MADLPSLIERLEKAEGPNFKLDFEVWCAAHGHTPNWDTGSGLGWYVPKGCDHVTLNDYWPAYTASLDASVGLVPEGWSGGFEFGPTQNGIQFEANLWNGQFAPDTLEVSSIANTPALALCIAALKARQSEKGTLTTQQGDTND